MERLIQIENNTIIRQICLHKDKYTLGRGAENDIVFDTPKVSRNHAVISRKEDSYYIKDNASANHVYINDKQISECRLNSGDRVNLSRTVALFYLGKINESRDTDCVLGEIKQIFHKKNFFPAKEVIRRIVSLDSPVQILNVILREVASLVAAERGFIAMTNENGDFLTENTILFNLPADSKTSWESLFSHSTIRQAVEKREKIFIRMDENRQEDYSKSILALELQSVMCAPLVFGDVLVGILYVDSGFRFSDFTETDQFLFTILADLAAIAIENARRYGQKENSVSSLQEEVDKSEERYRLTLETAPDPIIITRLADGCILQANRAFYDVFDCPGEKDICFSVSGLNLFVQAEDMIYISRSVKEKNEIRGFETRLRTKGGNVSDFLISAGFIQIGGDDCMVMIAADITERIKIEKELEAAKNAAENASRVKSEFIANMSHELRTPMNSILGFLELALSDSSLLESQQKNLNTAYGSAKLLSKILNEILDIAKLQSGRLSLKSESFFLKSILDDSLTRLKKIAENKNLYLKTNLSPHLSPAYIGDSGRLRQILVNLIDNAVKFTENGGVNVMVKPEDSSCLHFCISDTGIGIPEDRLDNIFECFTQADGSSTRRYGGTGLGTSVSKQLVELMGGKIWVESKHGKGSNFHFTVKTAAVNSMQLTVNSMQLTVNRDSLQQKILVSDRQNTDNCSITPDNSSLKDIFNDMLAAFEEYNPVAIEPFLEKLGQSICLDRIKPIQKHLDGFDFNKARQETLRLAQLLGIETNAD